MECVSTWPLLTSEIVIGSEIGYFNLNSCSLPFFCKHKIWSPETVTRDQTVCIAIKTVGLGSVSCSRAIIADFEYKKITPANGGSVEDGAKAGAHAACAH